MDRIDVVARVLHQVLDINSGQQCLMAIWPGRVLLARLEKLHCPNSLDWSGWSMAGICHVMVQLYPQAVPPCNPGGATTT